MPKTRDITVPLPADLHQFLSKKVKDGEYSDSGEVIRAALLALKEHDEFREFQLQRLRADVAVGLEQAGRGELVPAEQVFARVRRRLGIRRRKGA